MPELLIARSGLRNGREVRSQLMLLMPDADGMCALATAAFFIVSEDDLEPVSRHAVVPRHFDCGISTRDVAMQRTKRLTPAHIEATRLSRPRVCSAIQSVRSSFPLVSREGGMFDQSLAVTIP